MSPTKLDMFLLSIAGIALIGIVVSLFLSLYNAAAAFLVILFSSLLIIR